MMFAYRHIVILTGAGISAESGIQTFRASDGLWEEHSIEDVATPEGFIRNPLLVQSFYNQRRRDLQNNIEPNLAHLALAKLEKEFSGKLTLVTQNIDNLHERAGSKNLFHMHGELLKVRCTQSEQIINWNADVTPETTCSCCDVPALLRPHVVWFGEMPLHMDEIYKEIQKADLFICIGSSGVVYPAAGFVSEAALNGAHTIEINLEPSQTQNNFAEHRYGLATDLVPQWVDEILCADK